MTDILKGRTALVTDLAGRDSEVQRYSIPTPDELEETGRLDVLACVAGIQAFKPLLETEDEDWSDVTGGDSAHNA